MKPQERGQALFFLAGLGAFAALVFGLQIPATGTFMLVGAVFLGWLLLRD